MPEKTLRDFHAFPLCADRGTVRAACLSEPRLPNNAAAESSSRRSGRQLLVEIEEGAGAGQVLIVGTGPRGGRAAWLWRREARLYEPKLWRLRMPSKGLRVSHGCSPVKILPNNGSDL
jgi:hypothetical protein